MECVIGVRVSVTMRCKVLTVVFGLWAGDVCARHMNVESVRASELKKVLNRNIWNNSRI